MIVYCYFGLYQIQYSFTEEEHMLDVRLSVVWNGDRVIDDVYGFDGEFFGVTRRGQGTRAPGSTLNRVQNKGFITFSAFKLRQF